MLLVLNTRDYDHKLAYGLNNIIMDANLDQIDRAKVDIDSVNAIPKTLIIKMIKVVFYLLVI
jgi:hypothetical protein